MLVLESYPLEAISHCTCNMHVCVPHFLGIWAKKSRIFNCTLYSQLVNLSLWYIQLVLATWFTCKNPIRQWMPWLKTEGRPVPQNCALIS